VLAPTYLTYTVSTVDVTGTYYSVDGKTQVNAGQPIQPMLHVDIPDASYLATGKLFEGGRYITFKPFDPVITRVITEDTDLQQLEPAYQIVSWTPPTWGIVNSVRLPEGVRQRLGVIPAQFRATSDHLGIQRLFTEMTYTVYYSDTGDTIAPAIWQVDASTTQAGVSLTVEATDFSDVMRVVVAYTNGKGVWETVDLTQDTSNPSEWNGVLPLHTELDYFIQAVDGGGNVAIYDNKGSYFTLRLTYLPLILKASY
jgi:hypothetical protein